MGLDEGDAVVCERTLGTGSAATTMLANEALAEELKREKGQGNCPDPPIAILFADRLAVCGHRDPEDNRQDSQDEDRDTGEQLLRHGILPRTMMWASVPTFPGRSAPLPSGLLRNSVPSDLVGCDCPKWGNFVSVFLPTRIVRL